MKTLRFSLKDRPEGKPDINGALLLVTWKLTELLDLAEAGEDDRRSFETETVMLYAGPWQSWSPGWELAPNERFFSKVRLIPMLRKLSAAPWDMMANGSAPRKTASNLLSAGEVTGSFIMYLRAGSRYLVVADVSKGGTPPVCFFISRDRQLIQAALYVGAGNNKNENHVAELRVFLAQGYFSFKDEIKNLYYDDRFSSLDFLGKGQSIVGFRPGGYCSWYNHYTNIDEKTILSDLEGLASTDNLISLRYLKKSLPAIFQIDDGWELAVGDWEIDSAKFPRGLKCVAERIKAAGLIPGLWLAPFLLTRRSRLFRERPEWLLSERGRPVEAGWNPNWDGVFYCLDLSREDVTEYLRSLMNRVIDDWGFRYIKLDFLYAGFLSGENNRGKVAEYYERAITLLTERAKNAAGLPLACLGCGLPLGASYRHFPLSRIGTDTKESWDWPIAKFIRHEGRPSALLSLKETISRSFMNGAVYINDPDVVFLRTANCALNETEKECIALVNFLFAGQIMCSDNFSALCKTDFSLIKRMHYLYDGLEGDEYGATALEKDVFLLESRSGKISGLINLKDKPFHLPADSGHFSGGTWLVDHRKAMGFEPHSISVVLTFL
jgi:alpha-galactosidase